MNHFHKNFDFVFYVLSFWMSYCKGYISKTVNFVGYYKLLSFAILIFLLGCNLHTIKLTLLTRTTQWCAADSHTCAASVTVRWRMSFSLTEKRTRLSRQPRTLPSPGPRSAALCLCAGAWAGHTVSQGPGHLRRWLPIHARRQPRGHHPSWSPSQAMTKHPPC